MRIGLVIYGLDRPLTGIGRYQVEFIRALAKLTTASSPASDLELVLLSAGTPGVLGELHLPTEIMPGCKLLPGLMTLGSQQMPHLARRLHLDVVHDLVGVAPFALGAANAKIIVTLHDVIPWSFPGVSTQLDTLIYRHWHPRVMPRMDAVITVSESSRCDIERHLHYPASQIFNASEGADSRFQPASPNDEARIRAAYGLNTPYMLYVGSVEERKNLRRVLQAYAELDAQTRSRCRLVIVGPQKWKYEGIFKALQGLDLEREVVFTGYVADADLPILYSAAEVFVYPSLYEGFGLPVLEAMSCGTPVITSTASSLPEVIGDAGLQVDPYDVSALTHAMQRVLSDADLRQQMRERGIARAAHFTWEQTAQHVLNVYRQLLGAS
jgi:glycosyltransferase involved in cell wall biosynthesis